MKPGALRRTLIIAACVFVFDGLVMGQGVIGVLVFLVALLAGGIRILIALLRKDGGLLKLRAAQVGVYFLMAVAIVVTIYTNNWYAARQADRVIAACRRYETKYHHLPVRLQELVPEFLPSIRRAKSITRSGMPKRRAISTACDCPGSPTISR